MRITTLDKIPLKSISTSTNSKLTKLLDSNKKSASQMTMCLSLRSTSKDPVWHLKKLLNNLKLSEAWSHLWRKEKKGALALQSRVQQLNRFPLWNHQIKRHLTIKTINHQEITQLSKKINKKKHLHKAKHLPREKYQSPKKARRVIKMREERREIMTIPHLWQGKSLSWSLNFGLWRRRELGSPRSKWNPVSTHTKRLKWSKLTWFNLQITKNIIWQCF